MVVSACSHESSKKHGEDRNGNQRFRCLTCSKTFVDAAPKPLGDMRIEMKDAVLALNLLLEGMSIRAVERLIDRETKLILAHEVGQRDNETCGMFLRKLRAATSGRLQLSTDGLAAYTLGVPFTFQGRVDFGQLIKNYGGGNNSGRYSPARLTSAEKRPMYGAPDHDRICTSHIERFNLTLRMNVRRFTRLTNVHSKSLKHHSAMQSIFFAWYNFCRKHEAIKTTPAVAAGIADKQWTLQGMLEASA